MQPGVYSGISSEAYHSSAGVSTSYLKEHRKAPAKARFGERRETEALKLGSLIHCAVTEPERLATRYAVTKLDRTGTKAWEDAERQAGGRILIKQADWDDALRMRDAVYRHPIARELLGAAGPVEDSFWWIDPETGVLCRGRADKIAAGMGVVVDLKSTEDASPAGFAKSVETYLYDWQNVIYTDGLAAAPGGFQAQAFVFLAIEKSYPHLVGAYELQAEDVDKARHQVREQMRSYRQCEITDTWPGYSDTLEPLAISARADFR